MRTIKTIVAAGMLLGATSVMAQEGPTYPKSADGHFKFQLEDNYSITCEDGATITDRTKMVVASQSGLKTAEAVVTCEVDASLRYWYLSLTAKNQGKMEKTGETGTYLLLSDGGTPVEGVLNMWVGFTERDGSGTLATVEQGQGEDKTVLFDGTALTTAGEAGANIDGAALAGKLNLATVLDNDAVRFKTPISDKFTFEIHAAFVDPAADPVSTAGTYVETITLDISSSPI